MAQAKGLTGVQRLVAEAILAEGTDEVTVTVELLTAVLQVAHQRTGGRLKVQCSWLADHYWKALEVSGARMEDGGCDDDG